MTGCAITGDLDALIKGRDAVIRQTGRIVITDVPVPELGADRPIPPDRRGWTGWEPRFDHPVHLMIETLPAQTTTPDAARAIADRATARRWHRSHPELARHTSLPITEVYDLSTHDQIRIGLVLEPGTDPAAVRDQVAAIDGITLEHTPGVPGAAGRHASLLGRSPSPGGHHGEPGPAARRDPPRPPPRATEPLISPHAERP